MTENKRLIQGSYCEQRYLHSDEIFCKERNWNINLPSEREFKNGYCIITDKDNTAYSIDELIELLNEFQKENEQLKQQLDDNLQFLIRASKRLGFESLDHLLYTLDKGEITGYSTANWGKGDVE